MFYIIQTTYRYQENTRLDKKQGTTGKLHAYNFLKKSCPDHTPEEIKEVLNDGGILEPKHSWGGDGAIVEIIEPLPNIE